jgi:hypothetical protein
MVFKLSTPTVIVEELNPLMVFKPSTPTVIVEELSPLMVFKQSTSCLPMVGGSLRVLWFLPPLKLVAMI